MTDNLLRAICPVCQGCGRTSINPNTGELVPQPFFTSHSTTAPGWTKCVRCDGSGVVVIQAT
jgi:hypothetical protein